MQAVHPSKPLKPLRGIRILSLALNIPGPMALVRLAAMGARCSKIEPPAGDPMRHYNAAAYDDMHSRVKVLQADLRTENGQKLLERQLARTDVLMTSFRPSGLAKLGLGWKALHQRHPALCQVAIVGAHGARAEEPGHDLTYMAENDQVNGLNLPPTLYADMGGSLLASEAVLQVVLQHQRSGKGVFVEVALACASTYLGLPRTWGMTLPTGAVGGAHAGHRMYPCKDGRVAVAALEPHFAAALCQLAGVATSDLKSMFAAATHEAVARCFASRTCTELDALGQSRDIPIHTLKEASP
jgi:crotonobetainyl-CoA:carnitine CoA-transferase CaiB-like acyl-CoA transferase